MLQPGFELAGCTGPEPWGHRWSECERRRYGATLAACGPGRFDNALEIGAAVGVVSAALAARCRRFTCVDFSPTSIAGARRLLRRHPRARAICGELPGAIPAGPFDLVVVSEVLYYLTPAALEATLDALAALTAPGARFVVAHWRPEGSEQPGSVAEIHACLRAQPWLQQLRSGVTEEYLLDVLERL